MNDFKTVLKVIGVLSVISLLSFVAPICLAFIQMEPDFAYQVITDYTNHQRDHDFLGIIPLATHYTYTTWTYQMDTWILFNSPRSCWNSYSTPFYTSYITGDSSWTTFSPGVGGSGNNTSRIDFMVIISIPVPGYGWLDVPFPFTSWLYTWVSGYGTWVGYY